MTKLTLYVPRLVASLEDRTLKGLLLPFGEPGQTNLGRLTASKESKLDVANQVVLNVQHDRKRPIGKAMTLTPTDAGMEASFHVLETRDGDDALLEASEGVRAALSVEIEPIVVRNGQIVSGTITGAGLVSEPAFPSARLAAEDAAVVPDMGDTPDFQTVYEGDLVPAVTLDGDPIADVSKVTVSEKTIDITTTTTDAPPDASATKEEPTMAAAATVTSAALAASKVTPKKDGPSALQKLYATLAGAAPAQDQIALRAALADVVPADILGIDQGQYVGELWAGNAYERRIVPLYNHATLTSFKVKGWQWVTKPEVDDYAGNKTAVPSAEIETEPVEIDAYRLAGAHNIDRKFRDFGDTEFWDAYYRAMSESTSKKSDVKVRGLVAAGATQVHLLNAAMTSGVPQALNLMVKGILKIVNDLETLPDHALVETDVYEPLLYTKEQDVLAYLNAALGFKDGTLGSFRILPVPVGSLTVDQTTDFVGKVMVGCKDAATVHELGGEAPIRIEAPNIALGGVDSGVFYYGAVNIHSADGLVLYDAPTAS